MREYTIIRELSALLDLFEPFVPDRESNRKISRLCHDKGLWHKAHGVFSSIRDRRGRAEMQGDKAAEGQYLFEEWVLKTLYNLTKPEAPFDAHSPYWIAGSAIRLARLIGAPTDDVLQIIAVDSTP